MQAVGVDAQRGVFVLHGDHRRLDDHAVFHRVELRADAFQQRLAHRVWQRAKQRKWVGAFRHIGQLKPAVQHAFGDLIGIFHHHLNAGDNQQRPPEHGIERLESLRVDIVQHVNRFVSEYGVLVNVPVGLG